MSSGAYERRPVEYLSEEETEPQSGRTEIAKFRSRRDKALATIVLSVDIALLYLIGNSEHPAAVWKKLADQFEKKTWATRQDWISAENYTQ